jgi:MscS family membrane protein
MRTRTLVFALLASALGLGGDAARAQSEGGEETATEPEPRPLPAERTEVGGTCKSPRQVWLQHLWWSTRERYDRAAACFDTTGLTSDQAAQLAERLFDHLNAYGLFIDTADPDSADAGYIDPVTGQAAYFADKAPRFEIRKYPDGRWRFTPEALEAIPPYSLGKRVARMLPPWFNTKVLGVPAWSYLGIVLLVFVAFVARRITVYFVNRYVARWAQRARVHYFDQIADKIDRPIAGLSMAAVFFLGFPLLAFPVRAAAIALLAVKALAAFSVVWLGYRLIDVVGAWMLGRAAATESKLDDQLVPLVTKTLKVVVSVVGGIFVLQNLDVNVSSLLAGVGLGGLAFALAAKDTVANFFGSLMIFVDKPFQIGDWIKIDDVEGTVEEVGFRTTKIRTFYRSRVTMPNSIIANTKTDNYGAREYRRYVANLGLTYDTAPEKVQAFCEGVRAIIARLEGMRRDYYLVEFKEFGDSGLIVMVYCFMVCETYNDEMRIRTRLNLEIMRLAESLGVGFAFPTRTLHIETQAAPGETRVQARGPSATKDIAGIVESFGPGGELGRAGFEVSKGYDCRQDWSPPDAK